MAEVDLLYFGALRDALGRDGERVDPPSHVLTLDDLIGWLAERGEPYRKALAGEIGGAVEGHMASRADSFFGAREVALFPPPGVLSR
jgi:molybdopterin synthase sulfur carrier subunit